MTWAAEHLVFLDHWDDLISDFSVLHHVHTPLERLPACWLWPMAERLAAYQGVVRVRAEQDHNTSQPHTPPSRSPQSTPAAVAAGKERVVRPTQDFRPDDPLLAGLVETSHHKAGSTPTPRGS